MVSFISGKLSIYLWKIVHLPLENCPFISGKLYIYLWKITIMSGKMTIYLWKLTIYFCLRENGLPSSKNGLGLVKMLNLSLGNCPFISWKMVHLSLENEPFMSGKIIHLFLENYPFMSGKFTIYYKAFNLGIHN